jgi:hypothetical protein
MAVGAAGAPRRGAIGRASSTLVPMLIVILGACASAPKRPSPDVAARARAAQSWSGALRVSLKGPAFRGRAQVVLALRRPDALRLELPGPTGARLIAVAREGRLAAVFPPERAVFLGEASAAQMEALLGVGLTPAELFDVLVGAGSPRLRSYEARWDGARPREVRATLPDGGTLKATVTEADLDEALPAAAFDVPVHDGYRIIDAQEARSLWSR